MDNTLVIACLFKKKLQRGGGEAKAREAERVPEQRELHPELRMSSAEDGGVLGRQEHEKVDQGWGQ